MPGFMSKKDLATHIKNGETYGVSAGETYEQLRQNGWQLEGDPNPVAQPVEKRTPTSFSWEGQKQLEKEHPIVGPLAMPFKQAANFAGNAFDMAKQVVTHPIQTIDSAMGVASGAITDALQGPMGIAKRNITGDAPQSRDQEMFHSAVDQYTTNYGVKNFAKAGGELLQGNVKNAANAATAGLDDINKTLFESPAAAAMDYLGAKQSLASGLKNTGFNKAASAVDNFAPADHFLNDVMGPVVDNTPYLGRISRGYAKNIDPVIDESFAKAIRPTAGGKDTLAQRTQYKTSARNAVKAVVQSKDQLKLTNEFGEAVTGLPQNLEQFSQAIAQTKQRIYTEYNALQKQAGSQGMTVKLEKLVNELNQVADDPTIQDLAPNVAEYARARAATLQKRGVYQPEQAQSAAQTLNTKLQAFYKNPNPNDISVSMVDALIKNHLVDGIDNAVLEATNSPSYMPLRKKYGDLKAVEKDINHRATVHARQSNKGFFDLSNVFTYGDIARGLVSHNPADIAQGLVGRGIAAYNKYRNNPNTILKGMFDQVDKAITGSEAPFKKMGLSSQEIQSLTPEERATGIMGGGGDNMPRAQAQKAVNGGSVGGVTNNSKSGERVTLYRGQSDMGGAIHNKGAIQRNVDGGIYFTRDKAKASAFGDNVVDMPVTSENIVTTAERKSLQEMATTKVQNDMRNMIETDEVIEGMALNKPKAFAEYTKKPFLEAGGDWGATDELLYYRDFDTTASQSIAKSPKGLPREGATTGNLVEIPAMKQYFEKNGIKVNPDNTVTVYHATTAENAASIENSGLIRGGSGAPNGMPGTPEPLGPSAFAGFDKKWTVDTWGSGRPAVIEMKVPVNEIRHGAQNFQEAFFEGGIKRGKDGLWHPVKLQDTFVNKMAVRDYSQQKVMTDSKITNGLLSEAKKYKTEQEFVDAVSGNKIYRNNQEFEDFIKANRAGAKPYNFDVPERVLGYDPAVKGNKVKIYRVTDATTLLPGDSITIYDPRRLSTRNREVLGIPEIRGGMRVIEEWIPKKDLYQDGTNAAQVYAPDGITSLSEVYRQANQ